MYYVLYALKMAFVNCLCTAERSQGLWKQIFGCHFQRFQELFWFLVLESSPFQRPSQIGRL